MTTTKQETGAITILQIRKLKCRERRSVEVKQVADLRLTLQSFCLQNTGSHYEPLGLHSNENTSSTGLGTVSKREPAPFDDLFVYTVSHPPRARGDLIIVCFSDYFHGGWWLLSHLFSVFFLLNHQIPAKFPAPICGQELFLRTADQRELKVENCPFSTNPRTLSPTVSQTVPGKTEANDANDSVAGGAGVGE